MLTRTGRKKKDRKEKNLSHATWMSPENIKLSKINWSQNIYDSIIRNIQRRDIYRKKELDAEYRSEGVREGPRARGHSVSI